ncbi:MAG: tRNA 2-thiouridine(34) synthase MnmA [Caldisericia bacterium]|nr:tRNA 2-thiouridine(34) synthase MnmA [Caldisericia bacterium]
MHDSVNLLTSGGIDSAIAAYVLVSKGYDVHCIYLKMHNVNQEQTQRKAMDVASFFSLPFSVLDVRNIFTDKVVTPLTYMYRNGKTPNPCVMCNPTIKFGKEVTHYISSNSHSLIASGHYAQMMEYKNEKHFSILKAVDKKKDQSYFMYRINPKQYGKMLFPIGGYTKEKVKEIAKKIGFKEKSFTKESTDLCFYEGSYKEFAKENIVCNCGNIVDENEKILGKHNGISLYTIGQRQGLGISSEKPLYVKSIVPEKNEIIVSRREDMYKSEFLVKSIVWNLLKHDDLSKKLNVKIRYRSPEALCSISKEDDTVIVRLDTPAFAITPGQSAVFYIGDRLIGGGIIA